MMDKPNSQSEVQAIARLSSTDWDRAIELAESVSKSPNGMKCLVSALSTSDNAATVGVLVGTLSKWHESTWKPRETAILIVLLISTVQRNSLNSLPEIVGTLLTIIDRIGFEDYVLEDLESVLGFVVNEGIGNSSRLQNIIIPHASDILSRAQEQGYAKLGG